MLPQQPENRESGKQSIRATLWVLTGEAIFICYTLASMRVGVIITDHFVRNSLSLQGVRKDIVNYLEK